MGEASATSRGFGAAGVVLVAAIGLGWAAGTFAAAVCLAVVAAGLTAVVTRLVEGQTVDRSRIVDLETAVHALSKRVASARETATIEARIARLEGDFAQHLRAPDPPAPVLAPPPPEEPGEPLPVPPPLAAPVPADADAEQPELPMVAPAGTVELSRGQVVRALNFPETAEDAAGFDLLRRALARPDLAQLLQAAEDCLNFLAQEQLYADDLMVTPASASDWRVFAKGGAARAALMPIQGIRDTAATEVVRTRMRADPVFRDAALVFQRRFDAFLGSFAKEADDREVTDLMDTRSGRAFVLFAQVSGTLS